MLTELMRNTVEVSGISFEMRQNTSLYGILFVKYLKYFIDFKNSASISNSVEYLKLARNFNAYVAKAYLIKAVFDNSIELCPS